jgi:hypothetical protein
MHLEAETEYHREALGGNEQPSLGMQMEAEIKVNTEMHLEAIIEPVGRSTERP